MIKKFWLVKSKDYDDINKLSGSDLSEKDLDNIKSGILSQELYLVYDEDDEDDKKIWVTFPTTANDWLIENGYVYQGQLSLKEIRKQKLIKINEQS